MTDRLAVDVPLPDEPTPQLLGRALEAAVQQLLTVPGILASTLTAEVRSDGGWGFIRLHVEASDHVEAV